MKSSGIFLAQPGAGREHFHTNHHHSLISWRAILAGLFLAGITYVALIMLGLALAGASAYEMIQEDNTIRGLASGATTWMALSVLLSLGIGSYFAARTSTFVTRRIGAAQGLLIAAIFFGVMGYGISQGIGSIIGVVGMGASNIASSPLVQNQVEDAIGSMDLKEDPAVVVQGVISRLMTGDTASARTFLINQSGQPESVVAPKLAALERDFKATVKTISVETAEGVEKGAWLMFAMLITGIGMAALGGAAGSWLNFKDPLVEEDHAHAAGHVATVAYSPKN
jgi:hypothetical protein